MEAGEENPPKGRFHSIPGFFSFIPDLDRETVTLCHTNKACPSLEDADFKNRDVGPKSSCLLGISSAQPGLY